MGTQQHFVLFEHVTGFVLFRVKEFDEITRNFTAHANAFVKPIAFVPFNSVSEAVENVQAVANGMVTNLLRQFLRTNVSPRNVVLGVSDESLGKSITACEFGFECIWTEAMREILRVIRQNFIRLTRSLITQPGNAVSLTKQLSSLGSGAETIAPGRAAESRARLVVGLSCARMHLNFNQHLADTTVIRALTLIDELDTNLTRSASRLRASYGSHFPEICHPSFQNNACLNDVDLIRLIAHLPARADIVSTDNLAQLHSCVSNPNASSILQTCARDSVGCELSGVDAENLKSFAQHLLKMMEMRKSHAQLLSKRIESVVPNLNALLKVALPDDHVTDESENRLKYADSVSASLLAARLIANAGSVTRLGNMPTSRILSLGASKALFRRSGAVAATATGLLGTTSQHVSSCMIESSNDKPALLTATELRAISGNRVQPDIIRRRAARLLAAKASLACRADCFRAHNPATAADKTDHETNQAPTEDIRLTTGQFGVELGENMKHQLRVWAETNGVHVERTQAQIQEQRDHRKKYRKKKRKAWLNRKLSRASSGLQQPTGSLKLVDTLMRGNASLPTVQQESIDGGSATGMDIDSDSSETASDSSISMESDHLIAKPTKIKPSQRCSTRIRSKQLVSSHA